MTPEQMEAAARHPAAPTPYRAEVDPRDPNAFDLADAEGRKITRGYWGPFSRQTMDFIAQACNAHGELLSLLKEALAAIEDEVDTMEEDSCLYASYVACGRCEAGLPMPHSLAHRMQLAIMREERKVSDGA